MSEHNVKFLDGKDKTKELLGRTRTSLVFRPDGQNAEVAIHNLEVEKADKAYVDEAISTIQLAEVVDELPETGEKNKLYLVPRTDSEDKNLFDEYLWIDHVWEMVGSVSTEVDLRTYPEYSNFTSGFNFSSIRASKTNISVADADRFDISEASETAKFLTPNVQHYATFYGLARAAGVSSPAMVNPSVGKYTDQAKTAIQDMLGVTEKINELQLFKFPNATIIGEPTINNGQISGFGQNAYLKFPFLVDFNSKPFEINMEFTTGTNIQSQENIFDSDFGLAFAIRNGKFVIAISTNGTSWNLGEGVGTHTVQPNATYRVKFSWDRMTYRLSYSTDGGKNYTEDITKVGAFQPAPKQIYIGAGENFGAVFNWFTGIINMNHCTLSILGQVIWQGMDDAGLATRLETDLSNIDQAGIDRLNSMIDDKINSLDKRNVEY